MKGSAFVASAQGHCVPYAPLFCYFGVRGARCLPTACPTASCNSATTCGLRPISSKISRATSISGRPRSFDSTRSSRRVNKDGSSRRCFMAGCPMLSAFNSSRTVNSDLSSRSPKALGGGCSFMVIVFLQETSQIARHFKSVKGGFCSSKFVLLSRIALLTQSFYKHEPHIPSHFRRKMSRNVEEY